MIHIKIFVLLSATYAYDILVVDGHHGKYIYTT
jgi:hypothetical protein